MLMQIVFQSLIQSIVNNEYHMNYAASQLNRTHYFCSNLYGQIAGVTKVITAKRK